MPWGDMSVDLSSNTALRLRDPRLGLSIKRRVGGSARFPGLVARVEDWDSLACLRLPEYHTLQKAPASGVTP